MKLSTAWRRLARFYDAMLDADGRVPYSVYGGPWLCNNIAEAGCGEHYDAMRKRIHEDVAAIDPEFYDIQTYDLDGHCNHPSDNRARVLVCLMFAEEVADAERERAKRQRQRAIERANVDDCLGFCAQGSAR